jgi:hypothetical protein
MAGRTAGKSRLFRAAWSGVSAFLSAVGRVVRLLFLQMVGLIFCLLAASLVVRIPRAWHDRMRGNNAYELYVLCILSLMFLWFGLTSFWRARKR